MKEGRKNPVPSQDSDEEQRSSLSILPAIAVQGMLCTQHCSSSPYGTRGRAPAAQGLGLFALVYNFLHLYDLIWCLLHSPKFGMMLSKHFAALWMYASFPDVTFLLNFLLLQSHVLSQCKAV